MGQTLLFLIIAFIHLVRNDQSSNRPIFIGHYTVRWGNQVKRVEAYQSKNYYLRVITDVQNICFPGVTVQKEYYTSYQLVNSSSKFLRMNGSKKFLLVSYKINNHMQLIAEINTADDSSFLLSNNPQLPPPSEFAGMSHASLTKDNNYLISYVAEDLSTLVLAKYFELTKQIELLTTFSLLLDSGGPGSIFQCEYLFNSDTNICLVSQYNLGNEISIYEVNTDYQIVEEHFLTLFVSQNDNTVLSSYILKINNNYLLVPVRLLESSVQIYLIETSSDIAGDLLIFNIYTVNNIIPETDRIYLINDGYFCFFGTDLTNSQIGFLYSIEKQKKISNIFMDDERGKGDSLYVFFMKTYDYDQYIIFTFRWTQLYNFQFNFISCKNITKLGIVEREYDIALSELYDEEAYDNMSLAIVSLNFYSSDLSIKGKTNSKDSYKSVEVESELWEKQSYVALRYKGTKTGGYTIEYVLRGEYKNVGEGEYIYVPSFVCSLHINLGCYTSCGSCKSTGDEKNHSCVTCREGYYKEQGTNNCYKNPPNGMFFDSVEKAYKSCYHLCESCFGEGNEKDQKCLKCKLGYSSLSIYTQEKTDEYTCVKNCNLNYSNWYISKDNKFICTNNKKSCPSHFPFLNKELQQCNSRKISSKNQFIIGDAIEDGVELFEDFYKELFENKENIITPNYEILLYSLSFGQLTNVENYSSSTNLDFGECEGVLRDVYKIKPIEEILVAMLEVKQQKEYAIPRINYMAYSQDYKRLNLSYCTEKNLKINTSNYIGDYYNLSNIEYYLKKKIDVFNSSNPVFFDYCQNFASQTRDIILNDRAVNFRQQHSACSENCVFVFYENSYIHCQCEIKEETIKGQLAEEYFFQKLAPNSNIKLFGCYKKFFSKEILTNPGFLVVSFCFLSNVVCFGLYLKIKPSAKVFPNPTNIRKAQSNSLGSFFLSKNKLVSRLGLNDAAERKRKIKARKGEIRLRAQRTLVMRLKEKTSRESEKEEKSLLIMTNNLTSLGIIPKKDNGKLNEIQLTHKDYSFKSFFLNSHLLFYNLFCQRDKKQKMLGFFLLIGSVYTGIILNSLFYNDNYIHNNFISQGFLFVTEMKKVVYSLVIQYIFNKLVLIFIFYFESRSGAKGLLLPKAVVIFTYGAAILFHILCLYYVTIFCSVYTKTVKNWIICSVIHLILYFLIIPFSLSILVYFVNKISFLSQSITLFYLVEVISNIKFIFAF